MDLQFKLQLVALLRILVAAFCGACIGYERENRLKTAGIRTHIIVAFASALLMIVSKYGFFDILSRTNIGLDPSRVAAGVVSAIGFLGAGVIFTHKYSISGITTAAGIWATVGVGLTIGAGLYLVGVVSSAFLILIQILLHHKFSWLKNPVNEQITLVIHDYEKTVPAFTKTLDERHIQISSIKVQRFENNEYELKLYVKFPDLYHIMDIIELINNNPGIKSIDF